MEDKYRIPHITCRRKRLKYSAAHCPQQKERQMSTTWMKNAPPQGSQYRYLRTVGCPGVQGPRGPGAQGSNNSTGAENCFSYWAESQRVFTCVAFNHFVSCLEAASKESHIFVRVSCRPSV